MDWNIYGIYSIITLVSTCYKDYKNECISLCIFVKLFIQNFIIIIV